MLSTDAIKGMRSLFLYLPDMTARQSLGYIHQHPFALSMPSKRPSPALTLVPISDVECGEVAACLSKLLGLMNQEEMSLLKIYGPLGQADPPYRPIYFQVTTPFEAMMTCTTDKCMGGDHHLNMMDKIFEFLASCFDLEVQSINLDEPQYSRGAAMIREKLARVR